MYPCKACLSCCVKENWPFAKNNCYIENIYVITSMAHLYHQLSACKRNSLWHVHAADNLGNTGSSFHSHFTNNLFRMAGIRENQRLFDKLHFGRSSCQWS